MSLMAIILWALYPLSPWKRLYESARHLLQVILNNFQDPRFTSWLCANPDDPEGVARIERCLDDLNANTDLLIYQRAREILSLAPAPWVRPRPSPPQPRRTYTFSELYLRLEACALRFADIERLAQLKAKTLQRLLNRADPLGRDPAHAPLTASTLDHVAGRCLPLLQSNWGRWIAPKAQDGGGSRVGILYAAQRARAPP